MLAGAQRQGAVAALVDRLAAVDGEVAGLLEAVEAIAADAAGAKPPFVGVERELGDRLRIAQPGGDAAGVQVQVEDVVVEHHDLELGRRIEAQGGRAERDLGVGAVVGGDPVAGGQRPVALDRDPFVGVGAEQPDLAARFAEPRHPVRRVGVGAAGLAALGARRQRRAQAQQRGEGDDEPATPGSRGARRCSEVSFHEELRVVRRLRGDLVMSKVRGFNASPRTPCRPGTPGDTFLYTARPRPASDAGKDGARVSRRLRDRVWERARW